jgi:hypothetical protein
MINTGSFPKALQGGKAKAMSEAKKKKDTPPPLSSYGKKGKKKAC